ncbi:MAG TPA: DUF177 domain-containing protein [Verrucomicrobiae bacterium]|jgi:uncharacterized protein
MPAQVNIRHLEERDVELQGELLPEELELGQCDELIHVRQPLRFDLTVQRLGGDIVAQGDLELTLDCECSRCLKPYEHTVKLDQWTGHYPLEGPEKVEVQGDFVDLTPQIREDILLEFPQHPLCEADCSGLPNRSKEKKKGAEQTNGSSAWSELNKLKF